jgi:deazaflavin-dependent oxidoreductase (nitroreductase family)
VNDPGANEAGIGLEEFCYLTTTGRVTGRPHRIEIWFALRRGVAYMLAGDRERSDWVRNLLASPEVTLEIGARRWTARGRVLEAGSGEDELARGLLVEKYQPGYGEDLSAWRRDALPVAVDLPEAPGA